MTSTIDRNAIITEVSELLSKRTDGECPWFLVLGEWGDHKSERAALVLTSTNIEEFDLPGELETMAVLIRSERNTSKPN